MDFGKYCDCRNGWYVTHFPNFDKISEDELEELYTSYGPETVLILNNETGLCFVPVWLFIKKTMKDANNKEQDPQNKKWEPQNKESGRQNKKLINQGAIPRQPGYNNGTNERTWNKRKHRPSTSSEISTILPAQEVIIANIDPDAGIRDMFDLLKNYELIATTNIKQVPNSGIRYLHAYFTTVSDAIAVEKKFDKYKFFKHVLIALRPENLIEEVLYT